MKIRLSEIPQEGRSFTYDRKSAELNEALSDLISERSYYIEFFIKPIGNAYEMRGHLKTSLAEVCSKCGYDFELPLSRKINEVLFEEQSEDRKAQSVHGNQSVDFATDGPSLTPYRGGVFDPGDFAHEMIALSEPFYPHCGENGECANSAEAEEIRRRLEAEFARIEEDVEVKPNPFKVLKDLDLRKKN